MCYRDCSDVWDENGDGENGDGDKGQGNEPSYGAWPTVILLYATVLSAVLVSVPRSRAGVPAAAIVAIQGVLVSLYVRSLRPSGTDWSPPSSVTDPVAEWVLSRFEGLEFANPHRVPRFDPAPTVRTEQPWADTRGDVEDAFRRMFNFRVRWVLLVTFLLFTTWMYDWRFEMLALDLAQYGLALNFLGAFALAASVLRGPTGIARDTVDVLTHGTAVQERRHFCEKLLSSSANTIDGILGTTSLLFGFTLQLMHSLGP